MGKRKKKQKGKKGKVQGLFQGFWWIPLILGLALLVADYWTKQYVHLHLPRINHDFQWYPYGGIAVFEDFFGIEFSIVHAMNYGAAWGIFSEFQNHLLLFRIIFIIGLFLYALFFNKNRALTIPFTLIFAGALGNIIDYFIYGHVVDMLNFVFWGYHYPIFNLADTAICVGVGLILLITWIQRSQSQCHA